MTFPGRVETAGDKRHMSKKVMIVEDSVSMRQLVNLALNKAGYEVVEAENGRDALKKATATPVDMIITDLNMPGMDGLELIKCIKSNPFYSCMPVVMLTTDADNSKKLMGKEAGADAWIVKPFKVPQLVELVNILFNLARMQTGGET
jgi:two-component system chemotaxis response regulator CheY